MAHAKKYGGVPEDYVAIDRFLDQTKQHVPNWRHRMVLHNSFGVDLCIQMFGEAITNADGKKIAVQRIAEDHIEQDLRFVPSLQDCVKYIVPPTDPDEAKWVLGASAKKLSEEFK